jgi:hypothetical protein
MSVVSKRRKSGTIRTLGIGRVQKADEQECARFARKSVMTITGRRLQACQPTERAASEMDTGKQLVSLFPVHFVLHDEEISMWLSFLSGWLFLIVPFAMMFACVLMGVIMCRACGRGARCCGHMRSDERQGKPSS